MTARVAMGLLLVLAEGASERSIADSRLRLGRETESSETAWSVQIREEDFELYWSGLMGSDNSSRDLPAAGISLRFNPATIAAGGLQGLSSQMLGRRLSVFSLDAEGSTPGVGAGANVEGFCCELGGGRGGGFVSVAREAEGSIRKSAFLHAPVMGGRAQLSAGAFVHEEGLRELSWGGRCPMFDVMVSTGKTQDGPETSISLREKERRAALRATWRDGPLGRECNLACGVGISRGKFSATRLEISGSPFSSAVRDSRARGIVRSVWGRWRVFAGADSRRLAGGSFKMRGNVGFTKIVGAGLFATTDFAWESSERRTPGTASFTLAGRLGSFAGSLQSEITARNGRRLSFSLERGRRIRSRVAIRLADRANAQPRASLEWTVTRVD